MTTTAPELLREQVAIMLAATCHHAKRQMPKTRTFVADPPTAWDVDHERLDELITEWEAAR